MNMRLRGTYITATLIAVLIGVWLVSGQLGVDGIDEHPTLAQVNQQRTAEIQDLAPTKVRARVVHAVPQTKEVVVRGKTENKRTVNVKSELAGQGPLCALCRTWFHAALQPAAPDRI